MEQEGQQLAKASFGPTILLSIGKAYERQAAIHLGGFFQGSLVSLKQEGHSIKSKVLFFLFFLSFFLDLFVHFETFQVQGTVCSTCALSTCRCWFDFEFG